MSIYETFFECSGSEVGVEVYLPSSAKSFSLCFCSPVKMYIQGTSKLLLSTSARPAYPACCSTFQQSRATRTSLRTLLQTVTNYIKPVSACAIKRWELAFCLSEKTLLNCFSACAVSHWYSLYIVVRVWVKIIGVWPIKCR